MSGSQRFERRGNRTVVASRYGYRQHVIPLFHRYRPRTEQETMLARRCTLYAWKHDRTRLLLAPIFGIRFALDRYGIEPPP